MYKSRRSFIKFTGQSSVLLTLYACGGISAKPILESSSTNSTVANSDFWNGALIRDPNALFDLPYGFTYKVLKTSNELMSDGIPYGRRPDGMASFQLSNGDIALVINHEIDGKDYHLNPSTAYQTSRGIPRSGGTSTLILEPNGLNLRKSQRSLSGTVDNCAGGKTPWNTWISCEETDELNHGYAFEVDPESSSLMGYKRLTNMGRFRREAIAVDLNDSQGCVYQTEDDYKGLFYRFTPQSPGILDGPGQLHALVIPSVANTSNRSGEISVGDSFNVNWVPIDDPEAKYLKTRDQGKMLGASIFSGGEGIIFTNNKDNESVIFFTCKSAGLKGYGQMWAFEPKHSKITLFYESRSKNDFWKGDNINTTPWGDLIICEDNDSNACKLLGCTPNGHMYTLGRVSGNKSSEIAGICFSPDGTKMYLNIQDEGKTIVIDGDWNLIKKYRDSLDTSSVHYY